MGTFADSLFTVLMSWVRALVNAIWAIFSSDNTTVLEFLGKNWMAIALVIIAGGLVIDWIIWLLRWQPYHLWAQNLRRLLRIEEPENEETAPARAHAAAMPQRKREFSEERLNQTREIEPFAPDYAVLGEAEEDAVLEQAQSTPDEYAYPGMRYDSVAQEEMSSTQRYGAVTQEGPGAAEVARRRAEIDAWQLHMQEEARARAEAERARREAEHSEQARLAREAYEAEQARLAQAQYERQLAEYERQKAQYELELAEYERQKAEYEAQLAAMAQEQAQEIVPQTARRRRGSTQSYSDSVEGETGEELPQPPAWPQVGEAVPAAQHREHKLLNRMARMIEPEQEELAVRTKLPPRVNMQDAYKPAASPRKPGRRSRNR